jgi:hypothetical protein
VTKERDKRALGAARLYMQYILIHQKEGATNYMPCYLPSHVVLLNLMW